MTFDIKKYVHTKVAMQLPIAPGLSANPLGAAGKVLGGIFGGKYGAPQAPVAPPAASVTPPAPATPPAAPVAPPAPGMGTPAPPANGPTTVVPPAAPNVPAPAGSTTGGVPATSVAVQPTDTKGGVDARAEEAAKAQAAMRQQRQQQYGTTWSAMQKDATGAAKSEMDRIATIQDPVARHQAYQGLLAMRSQLPPEQQDRMAVQADEAQRQMDAITGQYVVKGQDQYKTPEEYNKAVEQAKQMEQQFRSGSQGNMQDMLLGRVSASGAPAQLVELAKTNPDGFAEQAVKAGMMKPEEAQAFKTVMGKDEAAFQKWYGTEAGHQAEATIAKLKQGTPEVGPDGKPVIGQDGKPVMKQAGIMDLLSQPGSIAMIGGILLALFGGKPGAIIGSLLAAGGGMNLWGRYKGATDPKTAELNQKFHAAQLAAGKDPKDYKALNDFAKANGYPPEAAQGVSDQNMLIETGMADSQMQDKAHGYIDRNVNFNFAPQPQAAAPQ